MRLDYTEFSYGYAFTENLIRSNAHGPASAPVFPNLVQEAQLGYDVRIDLPGVPIFFQFKLPQLMVRDTAKEISQFGLPGISTPFFRMPLMRRDLSDQHQRLIDLEGRFPGSVYYTTPLSPNIASFNAAYRAAQVHIESVLFSPIDIGPLPDDKGHSVAYSKTPHIAWRCSEPKEVKRKTFEYVSESISGTLSERAGQTLETTIGQIREGLDEFLPDELREAEGELRKRILIPRADGLDLPEEVEGSSLPEVEDSAHDVSVELLVIRELARVGLGVDILIAQPRQPETGEQEE